MYFVWSILPPPPDQNYFAVKLWWFFVSGTSRNQDMCVFRRSEWKCLKEAEMKEFTLYCGKRLIWLPAIRFFFSNEKGHRGMFWTKWPTWNTPKKGSLSRKKLKEDERVRRGHFHERVDESPTCYGHFGTNGSKISLLVPEIRPFEWKVWVQFFSK